jgi:nucleoid-associated protein YgaU
MNRQVGPSIVLSVLIVCFFAVALYQRDPPGPSHGRGRSGEADAVARSGLPPPRGASRSTTGQSESAELLRPASAGSKVPAQPNVLDSNSSIASVKLMPGRSSRARDESTIGPDGSKNGDHIEVVRQPGSAFTVVDANETLHEVARRVYGSGAVADSLWRANRDALARRDSPLSAGMVLRTPVLLTQSPLRK